MYSTYKIIGKAWGIGPSGTPRTSPFTPSELAHQGSHHLCCSQKAGSVFNSKTTLPQLCTLLAKWMSPTLPTIPTKVRSGHWDLSYRSYWNVWAVRLISSNSWSRSMDSSPQPGSPGMPTCRSGSLGVRESWKYSFQLTATPMQCALQGDVTGLWEKGEPSSYPWLSILGTLKTCPFLYAFALALLSSWNVFYVLLYLANLMHRSGSSSHVTSFIMFSVMLFLSSPH